MNRLASCSSHPRQAPPRPRRGYTIVELLTATLLTLVLMGSVVTIFGMVSRSVSDSRSTLEMTDRLRGAKALMQSDLEGLTVIVDPPRRPKSGEGYLQYTEGPMGTYDWSGNFTQPYSVAFNTDEAGNPPDTTFADCDDVLMFTTRSPDAPFVGWYGGVPFESYEAEVAWFVRGRTLYRRVRLVAPQLSFLGVSPSGFDARNDISVRYDATAGLLIANSLGDLTKPENRFAHNPLPANFPHHPHFTGNFATWRILRLPTLCECSTAAWSAGFPLPALPLTANGVFDAWRNPHPWTELDQGIGAHTAYYDPAAVPATQRVADDVILTNVIGFDVKAWDPQAPVFGRADAAVLPGDPGYDAALSAFVSGAAGATPPISYGAYVDLNYANGVVSPPVFLGTPFSHPGRLRDPAGNNRLPLVYDTWSFHYEHDGIDQFGDGNFDLGTNGFDDDGDGVVDDGPNVDLDGDGVFTGPAELGEMETTPPYPVPLRGIQVKIRTFEPDSRQVREVTVIVDFLPK